MTPRRPATTLPRRQLLLAAAAAPLTAGTLAGCSQREAEYAAAVADTWRDTITNSVQNRDQLEREIVRFAMLSPSHRNRQPWRFELGPGWITLRPDESRRLPVADPDDHHLHVSVGAALETMVVSAGAGGLDAALSADGDGVRVQYTVGVPTSQTLYNAIIQRQTARVPFSNAPVPAPLLDRFVRLATADGAAAVVVTDAALVGRILELTLTAVERQLRDPAWTAEFLQWLRFDRDEALARRDGVYTTANGYPAVPRWVGSRFLELVTTPARERVRYTAQLQGCGALLVIAAPRNEVGMWRAVGRAYQRIALVATAEGLRSAPANPALDYPDLRAALAGLLGLGDARPGMILRLGTGGAELPRSLRRPAADVTTGAG